MDFFNDINKAIENAGNTAKQKTKDLTDVAKMNASIKTEEKQLQEIYQQIGELFVKKYYAELEGTFQNLVGQARASEENIEMLTVKIQEIKKIGTCPNCGNEVSPEAMFCMRCGTRLVSEDTTEKAEHCKKCGNLLEEGMLFCTHCGEPIEKGKSPVESDQKEEKESLDKIKEPEEKEVLEEKVCAKCGNKLEEWNRFCTKCGAPVDVE